MCIRDRVSTQSTWEFVSTMSNQIFYGQIVIGPAGSGKSTYCKLIQDFRAESGKNILVVNLDPAAEQYQYKCAVDIRDLITLDDSMEEMSLGPNGGLIFCMEYLIENIDWLQEQLGDLTYDEYVLFDCPGQIELYTHLPVMEKVVRTLQQIGFSLCSVCLIDSTFITDEGKYFAGVLMAMSSMINLGLPHINVLSKCDLVEDKKRIKQYAKKTYDLSDIAMEPMADEEEKKEDEKEERSGFSWKYRKLTFSLKKLINEYSLFSILTLDPNSEDDIRRIIYYTDLNLQYGENEEPDDKLYKHLEEGYEKISFD
eukprot:TRINITY_DN8897_c0_g1_i1.p1 TRINITY_DN8897_c0_g1~~TRINITY_DN8897_c0_g1_i1.p1  ORF type:complete len:344 (+),score=95.26 TRINITY_DN8897_c0_g1_i1:97-1032(+)